VVRDFVARGSDSRTMPGTRLHDSRFTIHDSPFTIHEPRITIHLHHFHHLHQRGSPARQTPDGAPPTRTVYFSSLAPEDRLEITLTSGKNIEMTMKPTTNPRPTIMIGSKAAVKEASVASTSAS
jgi:hypothetical protein